METGGSGGGAVDGGDGGGGGEEAKRARDEEDSDVVGSHMVWDGRRDRGGDLRVHGTRGQNECGSRSGVVLCGIRRLRHALRLLLHRVRRRDPRRRYACLLACFRLLYLFLFFWLASLRLAPNYVVLQFCLRGNNLIFEKSSLNNQAS